MGLVQLALPGVLVDGPPPPRFATIVADPPWRFKDQLSRRRRFRGAATHYPTLSVQQIAALPIVPSLLADHAHLYLWTPAAFLLTGDAAAIAEAWGFAPKQVLTWEKPWLGMGHYYRNVTEHVLFAVRGKLAVLRRNARTSFASSRRLRHSEKPEEFFALVESVSPGPYVELFARRRRPGWAAWGDELAVDGRLLAAENAGNPCSEVADLYRGQTERGGSVVARGGLVQGEGHE